MLGVVFLELWDVLDEHGQKTGEIVERKKDFYVLGKNKYHLVVVAWIYQNGKFLCQQRSEFKEIDPLKWSIPGGSVNSGENSINGCIREVKEEVGLKLDKSNLIFVKRLKRETDLCDVYLINKRFDDRVLKADPIEVKAIKWMSYKEIINLMNERKFSEHREIDDVMKIINKGL